MNDPIVPFDLWRMVVGDAPPLFLLEIVVRTLLIYGYALVLIRWVGGRGIAQMSAIEFLLVVALGSAVGDPMFYPQVPVLHALVVITVVVAINKGLDYVQRRSSRIENVISGVTVALASDGTLRLDALDRVGLTREEFFLGLRKEGIVSLGEVRVAYLETSGDITVFRADPPKPGLPVEPPWDVSRPEIVERGGVAPEAVLACMRCGGLEEAGRGGPCEGCGGEEWTRAREA